MTFLENFDMYLIFFDIFAQYCNRFGQYLVMYLVTGLKGLPGEEIWVVTRTWTPKYCYGMQSTLSNLIIVMGYSLGAPPPDPPNESASGKLKKACSKTSGHVSCHTARH